MIVMVSNNTGYEVGVLAERYYPSLGHLYSPGGERGPFPELRYALDNGAFALWERNVDWTEGPWLKLLDWSARAKWAPEWAVVPDVITDRERTIERWHKYIGELRTRGIRPAFALQDGMTFEDVPSDDCMLFIGGSTLWKEAAIEPWCARFPGRVHVARVTEGKRLLKSYRAGAVSVDGNRWFMKTSKRGSRPQREVLEEFLAMQKREAERKAA